MITLHVVFLVIAVLCFFLSAMGVATSPARPINWQSMGFAFVTLAFLFP